MNNTWNKETQLVNMYFSEYFSEYAPFTRTEMRGKMEEMMVGQQSGLARELLLVSLNKVDWDGLVKIYNAETQEEFLIDEL